MKRAFSAALFYLLVIASPLFSSDGKSASFDPTTLPRVGYHLGGIAYWDTPYFANALWNSNGWIEFEESQWGSNLPHWNNPQFDANGYPRYLNPNKKLRAITYALHGDYGNRPAHWPRRTRLAEGKVVLAWKGDADIRLNRSSDYLAEESNGPETGLLADGRRVYRYRNGAYVQFLEIHEIGVSPLADIKVWLPDPEDPMNASLEGRVFHPLLLRRLAEADWGFIRFMNWQETNANPQRDWSDRRPPTHFTQTGTLHPRPPATAAAGNRGSGCALELLPMLCNAARKDLWVCIPHLATDDAIRRTARLIRFGSDGTDPYSTPTLTPAYPPLEPALRVYVEYSNEIWSNGYSFPQGDWAQEQAAALGITKAQFNARRFCQVWRIFEEEFGEEAAARLVRVAAVFTAADWYSRPFLREMAAFGALLDPPLEPDVVAVTTYFGNGIQEWAFERARRQADGGDRWFLTPETFDAGGGTMRPVSIPPDSSYWNSRALERHLGETFTEWKYRLLSGDAREGAGPDATGIGGGFDLWLRELARTTFPQPKPIIAYEGGPSLYTDHHDGGDPRDDGLTTFMEALNRRARFQEVYRIHLNMAMSKGLWTHVMFTDCSPFGKYGQWGHLESLDQKTAEAPKYQFLLDWIAEQTHLRHIDEPRASVPKFNTPHTLPTAVWGRPYSADITVSDGEGTPTLTLIGAHLVEGLEYQPHPEMPSLARVAGTPTASGLGFLYLRVTDSDGDPAWRTFTLRTVGGPDTLLECDFTGTAPAQNTPWTKTFVLAPGLHFSGWIPGAGIIPQSGDNALAWTQNMPANEADATLDLAIADCEYWAFSIAPPEGKTLDLRGHEAHFTIRRRSWHAPRRHAILTGIGGFTANQAVFVTPRSQEETDLEYTFTLPDTPAWGGLSGPVEFRLYGFAGQYGGHATSLVAFRLDGHIRGTGPVHTNTLLLY